MNKDERRLHLAYAIFHLKKEKLTREASMFTINEFTQQ